MKRLAVSVFFYVLLLTCSDTGRWDLILKQKADAFDTQAEPSPGVPTPGVPTQPPSLTVFIKPTPLPANLKFNISGNNFNNNATSWISIDVTGLNGAVIYYTTDGSLPTTASQVFKAPFEISGNNETIVVNVIVVLNGVASEVFSSAFWFGDWTVVGNAGFSPGPARSTSIYVYNGTPYVAFRDGNAGNAVSVMQYNGSAWVYTGNPGFSPGAATNISLSFSAAGIPHVAFTDTTSPTVITVDTDNNKPTVMIFDGNNWKILGTPPVVNANLNLRLFLAGETPYLAFGDGTAGYIPRVMQYTGGNWEDIGVFSTGFARSMSLYVDNNTPYIAFSDQNLSLCPVAYKFDGSSWHEIGGGMIDSSSVGFPSCFEMIVKDGFPCVAWGSANNSCRMKKFDNTTWNNVGSTDNLSAGYANYLSCRFLGTVPYIAFTDLNETDDAVSVIKYTGKGATGWEYVGNPGFSAGGATYNSLFIDKNALYVVYSDAANGDRATVMKFGGAE